MERHVFCRASLGWAFVLTFALGVDRAEAVPVAVTGIALRDATTILDKYNNGRDLDSIKSVLAGYGVRDPTDARNPFLAKVSFLRPVQAGGQMNLTLGSAQGGEAGSSPFSAEGIANALGAIIAERVKQDAEILALQALSAEINRLNRDARYDRPLEKLLPLSTHYVEKINPSAADPATWSVLQSDFRQDLQGLPNALPSFFDSLSPADAPLDLDRYVLHMGAALAGQIAVDAGNPYNIIDALARESSGFYDQQSAAFIRRLTVLERAAAPAMADSPLTTRVEVLRTRLRQQIDLDESQIAQLASANKKADDALTQKTTADRAAAAELDRRIQILPHLEKANAVFQALAVFSHALAVDRKWRWAKPQELEAYLTTHVNVDAGVAASAQNDPLFLLLGLSYALDPSSYQTIVRAIPRYERSTPADAVQALANDLANGLNGTESFVAAASQVLTQLSKLALDVNVLSDPSQKYALPDVQNLIVDLGGLGTRVCNAIDVVAPGTVPPEDFAAILEWQGDLYVLAQVAASARTGDYRGAVGALIVVITKVLPRESAGANGLVQFIAKEGPLVASLAAAKSQDDFTAALDSYALPAGSFTQIQHERHSWTLNAYFGGELGAEILTGSVNGTGARRVAPRLGFTAPVGIAYNWAHTGAGDGQSHGFFQTGSQSIFISALDVGAIASFRLESGSGGRTVAVRWSNIVAPGVYYVWTLKDTPLSIMVGTAYGPELRQVSATGGARLERAVWQLPIVAFTFNIPLFQFSANTQ